MVNIQITTQSLAKYALAAILATCTILFMILLLHMANNIYSGNNINKLLWSQTSEPFAGTDKQLSKTREYTSYTDMILQETIANRQKYMDELRSRDVAESYPWINIDGVWEQGSLLPSSIVGSGKGNEPWRRQRQWVPKERKYRDFTDILYIGNPLPK